MTVRGPEIANGPAEAHLWVCSGKNVGRRYAISEVPHVLGRAVACDIVVEDDRASQRHARVQFAQNQHFIEDLGSTNGTFVNSHRVQQTPLNDGDLIQIGETVFEYVSEGASAHAGGESGRVPDTLRSGQQGYGNMRAQPGAGMGMVPISQGHHMGHPPAYPPAPIPPPPYAGHYAAGYYDDDEDQEEGGGFDLIATLIRIRKIVSAYLPYWPLIASFIFIGVALGALYHKYSPVPFETDFEVILRPTGTGGNTEDQINFFGDQVTNRFVSTPVIEHALKRLTGQPPPAGQVVGIQFSLSFDKVGAFQSNMFKGGMVAQDGDFAIRYLNTHLRVFLDREVEMALSQVRADVDFFRSEVEKSAKVLDEAESAVSEYKSSHPDALPKLAESNYNLKFELQRRSSDLERSLVSLEASLLEAKRQLANTSRYIKSSETQSNPFISKISEIESQIAMARAQGKGDLHPDIIRLKRELSEYKRLSSNTGTGSGPIQVNTNPTYQRLEQRIQEDEAQKRALKREQAQVNRDLERQEVKLKSLPVAEAQYRELTSQYESANKRYKSLLDQLKNRETQLDRERARADSQYQIVVPPHLLPRNPNDGRFVRLIAGGAFGFILALILATVFALRAGYLSLGLIIGQDIDLKAVFRDEQEPGPSGPTSNRALVPQDYGHEPGFASNQDIDDDETMVPPAPKR